MTKLLKNIESSNYFKSFQMKNEEKAHNSSLINDRLKHLIITIKKMSSNMNAIVNNMLQQQRFQVLDSQAFSSQMSIARRSDSGILVVDAFLIAVVNT